jgi:hypothetical protein
MKLHKAKSVILAPHVRTIIMTFSDEQDEDLVAYINLLKPSGNFTYDQV